MPKRKVACYMMTRNLYHQIMPPLKSLLLHSDVEKVYLLIEDDYFPIPLPSCVECVNVSGQRYFKPDSPNYNSHWTYMVLMRAALPHLFEDEDMMLSLDLDTICLQDISGIWDYYSEDHYFAGVKEPERSKNGAFYVNCGVTLMNLKKLRDGKAAEVMNALNTKRMPYPEQDALNELCAGHILEMSPDYNVTRFTLPTVNPIIQHYAAEHDWCNYPIVKAYQMLPMDFNKREV